MKAIGTILFMWLGVALFTQAPRAQTNAPGVNQSDQIDMRMMQHMQEMDTMAKSMTSMADVCRMMMEKEMRSRPLKVAALAILGTLGVAALSLFVVLEIQWIRFWSVRIKTERLKLAL